MAEELVLKLKVESEGSQKKIADADKDMKKLKKSTDETNQGLGLADTKVGKMWNSFKAGAQKGIASMKTLRGAVIATGIGALVIVIISLLQYFTKTARGAEQLKVIFAALGQVVATITDTFIKIGETLVKIAQIIGKVVKGNATLKEGFQEAKEVGRDAINSIADSYVNLNDKVNEAISLAQRENQLRRDRMTNLVEEARLNTELAKTREQIDDVTLSNEERLAALAKAQEINNQISDERIRLAREEYEIVKAQNALSESTLEDMEKEAQLQATLINLEAERSNNNRRFIAKESSIRKAAAAERQKEADARIKELQEIQKLEESIILATLEGREKDLKALEFQYQKELQDAGDNLKKKKLLEEKYRLDVLAINAKYDEAEAKEQQAADDKQAAIDAKAAEDRLKLEEAKLKKIEELRNQLAVMQLDGQEAENEQLRQWYEQQLEIIGENEEAKSLLQEQYRLKQQDIQDKYDQQELAKTQAVEDQKNAIRMEAAAVLGAIGQLLQQVAGENEKLAIAGLIAEQAAGLAQVAINTTVAASKALAQMGPIAGAIMAGVIIAGGVVSAASIVAQTKQGIQDIKAASAKKGRGGWVEAPKHANGGALYGSAELEGQEYVVNANTMRNPRMASEVVKLNNAGNAGREYSGSGGITREEMLQAIREAQSIPVVVTENQITDAQSRVLVRQSRFTA